MKASILSLLPVRTSSERQIAKYVVIMLYAAIVRLYQSKLNKLRVLGGINIPSMIYFSILVLQLGEKRQSGEKCWSLKFAIHYRFQHLLIKQEQQPYF